MPRHQNGFAVRDRFIQARRPAIVPQVMKQTDFSQHRPQGHLGSEWQRAVPMLVFGDGLTGDLRFLFVGSFDF